VNDLDAGDSAILFSFGAFRHRWRTVLAGIAVCTAVAVAFTLTRQQTYESSADVLVLTDASTGLFAFDHTIESDLLRSAASELQIAQSDRFREAAAVRLTFDAAVDVSLPEPISSDTVRSVLRITARDSSAGQAQAAAQNSADSYVSLRAADELSTAAARRDLVTDRLGRLTAERNDLRLPIVELREQRGSTSDRLVVERIDREIAEAEADVAGTIAALDAEISAARLDLIDIEQAIDAFDGGATGSRVITAAPLPSNPVSPDVPRNVIVGMVAGLLVGLVAAMVRERRDTGARNPADVARAADTPMIGSIPELPRQSGAPGGVTPFAELPADHVNSYAAVVDAARSGVVDDLRSIAVIADTPGVGATQTAVNIGQAEAMRGRSVCIIDASFDRSGVATRLGLRDEGPGLADLLARHATLEDAIAPSDTHDLHVIGIGNVVPSSAADLASTRLQVLIAQLMERYGLIVVDIPPLAGPVDASGAAASCDGVVVVYNAASSRLDDIARTAASIRSAGAVPLGFISNRG
jgi:capsular exopolysaccharide synthesis family protein